MPHRSLWYRFVRGFVATFFYRLFLGGLRSVDESNVPDSGPVIIAPLHVSHLDPPAVSCGMRRQIAFMAKEELFKGILGKLIFSLGAFPVKRGSTDTESIRLAISILEEGHALLMFPEGSRGDGVTMGPINRGVAMLAKRTNAKVVPVGIVGTHKALPKGQSKLKRHPVTLVFGEPFVYDDIQAESEKERREAFAKELENRIRQLCASEGLELKSASQGEPTEAHPAPGTEDESPQPQQADTRSPS